MTKQDIIEAADEISVLLSTRVCKDESRLAELGDKYGHIPAIKKLFDKNYDARATHSGWGSPDCSCHIMPPCQACIDFTNGNESVNN